MTTASEVQTWVPNDFAEPEKTSLKLIVKLCKSLADERIAYCHWKSNAALDRCANGENDLDLLVARVDIPKFLGILHRLGFKEAKPAAEKQIPAIVDFYGYDEESGKLVHIHAHYQLIIGHDMSKNFRLPIETAYLNSAVQGDLFRVPAPEFEFIVLVFRLVLKHLALDTILGKAGSVRAAEQQEIDYLQALVCRDQLDAILVRYFPYIGVQLFNKCLTALQPRCSIWLRLSAGHQLQAKFQSNARVPFMADILRKNARRWSLAVKRRVFKIPTKHRLNNGGVMIAIVGGDGAGKTTLIHGLNAWLSSDFDTTMVHLGKPPKSLTTLLVRAVLKLGTSLRLYPHLNSSSLIASRQAQFPGKTPWMLREAFKARDRYLTYMKARRFVNNGGIVICDRFPLPQIRLMDGPVVEQIAGGGTNWLSRFLMGFEAKYYQLMQVPELVIVLRLPPDQAVQRKTDEDAIQVRARSTEVWEVDWRSSCAHVIDADQSQSNVLSSVKSLIWSEL